MLSTWLLGIVADVVIVPWRISGFVCSGAAVTEWEWVYKPLIHCRQDIVVDISGHSSPWNKKSFNVCNTHRRFNKAIRLHHQAL